MSTLATTPLSIFPPSTTQPPKQNTNLSLLQLSLHPQEAHQVHALIIKSSKSSDRYFAGRLAEFYSLSDDSFLTLPFAEKILLSLQNPPLFIYNTLMRGHLKNQNPQESIHIFGRILTDDIIEPDHFTFTFSLKASTQMCNLSLGMQLHAHVVKRGLESNSHVRNKLIHLYAVSGKIVDARRVFDGSSHLDVVAWNSLLHAYADRGNAESLRELFDRMPCRDLVAWNTVIAFYVEVGEFEEAMVMFRLMQESREYCCPDRVTLISVLSAASHLGTLAQGKWVHACIDKQSIELDEKLSSALINMYSKCGCIEGAVHTFEATKVRSVDTWNAMISGFTRNGLSSKAIDLFSEMERSGVVPDLITFACVLNACSHGGMVDEGVQLFEKMIKIYKIEPDIGHYGCMVDLYGRAGLFNKAEEIIEKMPMEPDAVVWKSLVGACRIHRNIELGKKAGYKLIEVAPEDHASFVLLSNVHAMAGDWNGVHKVRKMMAERGVKKIPGCSSIELDGIVHEFIAGDATYYRKKEIYEMLGEMGAKLRLAGYEPDTSQVLLDIKEEEVKESSLFHHSEKIAVAFGLTRTRAGTTIRVVKNLRVCGDCHSAIKLLSEIYSRDIIVRDSNRFHHFSNGLCSCEDYW